MKMSLVSFLKIEDNKTSFSNLLTSTQNTKNTKQWIAQSAKKVATFWKKDHTSGHSPCHYYLPESLIFLIGKYLNLSAQKL